MRLSCTCRLRERSPSGSRSGVTIWLNPFVVPSAESAQMVASARTRATGMALFIGQVRFARAYTVSCPQNRGHSKAGMYSSRRRRCKMLCAAVASPIALGLVKRGGGFAAILLDDSQLLQVANEDAI